MRPSMPLFLLLPLLVMGCASVQPQEPLLVPGELRLFTDKGTAYFTCLFDPAADHLKCVPAPSEPNQPRCL